jgi:hydrogenase maturation protease
MTAANRIVIGVGHDQRGDDAVGLLVARASAAGEAVAHAADLDVVEHDGDGMDLMLVWEGAQRVVVVDAVVSGERAPGEIARFEAHEAPLPTKPFASHSTHAFGVGEAIELARAMERLPEEVVVYGIEAACFDTGSAPGGAVRAAVEPVARRVLEELQLASPAEEARHA